MANLIRENIDRWFDYNLDVDNRTIYMGSIMSEAASGERGVDHSMAEYFIKGMHVLEAKSKTSPITIIMNNPGGDWYHGMAIYDAIKLSACPCTIKAYGYAMSMGSIILQAADERVMMPNSRLMIHYGTNILDNHSKVIKKWADEEERICYEMENLYLNMMLEIEEKQGHGYLAKVLSKFMNKQNELAYPPIPKVEYSFSRKLETKREELRVIVKQMLNFDTILNAQEAVDLGFADEVYKPQE